MNVQQRDVVLLPYPFSNLKQQKVRPGLVVSNDALNSRSDDCIMVPLTSVIKDEPYSVMISQQDMAAGNLIAVSRIRVDKIFCVDKALVRMKIGMLADPAFAKVKGEILKVF